MQYRQVLPTRHGTKKTKLLYHQKNDLKPTNPRQPLSVGSLQGTIATSTRRRSHPRTKTSPGPRSPAPPRAPVPGAAPHSPRDGTAGSRAGQGRAGPSRAALPRRGAGLGAGLPRSGAGLRGGGVATPPRPARPGPGAHVEGRPARPPGGCVRGLAERGGQWAGRGRGALSGWWVALSIRAPRRGRC